MSVKVIGFDLFGTVFNMRGVPREEILRYGQVIRSPEWFPFLWEKTWEFIPAFDDAQMGLAQLQADGYYVVAMSNAPLGLAMRMAAMSKLDFNAIIPLETIQRYKPDPATYDFAASLCTVENSEFLMVSANKDFGDIEAARSIGCKSQLIRHEGCPRDIIQLADMLKDGSIT